MITKVVSGKLTFNSLKPCDLNNCTKKDIIAYFLNSYDLNESIFVGLKDEKAFFKHPDRLRLPLIFYYGHTACVYVNKLILAGLIQPSQRVDLELETMLETGVDEMSWDDTENYRMGGALNWPTVERVAEYRKKVKDLILKVIEETPLELPVTHDSPWWSLFMGMEHERIHLETSSVLIRQLPISMVATPPGWKVAPSSHDGGAGKNALLRMDEREVTFGKPIDFPSYGWDNEYGLYKCRVPEFEASKYLIRNADFLEFVLAGGYKKKDFWTEEGWRWRSFREAQHPTFWICNNGCVSGCGADLSGYSHCREYEEHKRFEAQIHLTNGQNSYCNGHSQAQTNGHQGKDEGGGHHHHHHHHHDHGEEYRYRSLYEVLPMPWDWPVEVNYHEAKAYCAWRGPDFRLPIEAEHHVMRGQMRPVNNNDVSCDLIYQNNPNFNINFRYGTSTPVNMFKASSEGFYDVFGNVWEWMEDHFNGLPGYDTHHYYDDFSSPTYDGRHNVIMGGSWISTGDEASRFARYAFRRHFFQHCGFRIVKNIPKNDKISLPLRLITNDVLQQDNPVLLDTSRFDFVPVTSTNWQFDSESTEALGEMLEAEYSSNTTPFAEVIGERALEVASKYGVELGTAFHIGCGTGRATFTMAAGFEKILAIDYSASYIEAAQKLQDGGEVVFLTKTGPNKTKLANITLGNNFDRGNILFKQLTWLPNEVGQHDFVLFTSIDRLLNPKAWLLRLREVLHPDGVAVIISTGFWSPANILREVRQSFSIADYDEMQNLDGGCKRKTMISVLRHKNNGKV